MTNILLEGKYPINLENYSEEIVSDLDDYHGFGTLHKSILFIHSFIGNKHSINIDWTEKYFETLISPFAHIGITEHRIVSQCLENLYASISLNQELYPAPNIVYTLKNDRCIPKNKCSVFGLEENLYDADYIVAELSEANLDMINDILDSKKPILLFSYSENEKLFYDFVGGRVAQLRENVHFRKNIHSHLIPQRARKFWYFEYFRQIIYFFAEQQNQSNLSRLFDLSTRSKLVEKNRRKDLQK